MKWSGSNPTFYFVKNNMNNIEENLKKDLINAVERVFFNGIFIGFVLCLLIVVISIAYELY